jgi:WD40 repeat protein
MSHLASFYVLASGSDDNTIRLWDPSNGEMETDLDDMNDPVSNVYMCVYICTYIHIYIYVCIYVYG